MKYILNNKPCEIIFEKFRNISLENDIFVIIDKKIFELYSEKFNFLKERIFIFDSIEKNKNLDILENILAEMHKKNVNRKTLVLGIGGGITTDIAGFAASVFKRGCRLMLIPTTLLSMVDAAIGGKTGVNFAGMKNGIGNFFPAEQIIIDLEFLNSLPNSEISAGMVEIIKMSFLPNFRLNMTSNQNSIRDLIEESIRTKMEVCVNDFEDRSSRRLLNLGHTFGHVLESVSNYEVNHGTAVAIGMRAAAKFSKKKKLIDQSEYNEINARFVLHDLPNNYPAKYLEEIKNNGENILKQDKKAEAKINLVLFTGKDELQVFPIDETKEIIEVLLGFAHD